MRFAALTAVPIVLWPLLAGVRLMIAIAEGGGANWALATVHILLAAAYLFVFYGGGRSMSRVSVGDREVVVRNIFRTFRYPSEAIERVHTELFGNATLTVRAETKKRTYGFALKEDDVPAFREAIRQVAPTARITGLLPPSPSRSKTAGTS